CSLTRQQWRPISLCRLGREQMSTEQPNQPQRPEANQEARQAGNEAVTGEPRQAAETDTSNQIPDTPKADGSNTPAQGVSPIPAEPQRDGGNHRRSRKRTPSVGRDG